MICAESIADIRKLAGIRLRAAAAGWTDRVQTSVARSDEPLEGILVRPDGYVAWAAAPGDHHTDRLRHALRKWFGVAG